MTLKRGSIEGSSTSSLESGAVSGKGRNSRFSHVGWTSGDEFSCFNKPWYDAKHFPPRAISYDRLALTDNDLRAVREIRYNAIWYRGVPVGFAAIGAVMLLRRRFDHVKRFAIMYSAAAFGAGVMLGSSTYKQQAFDRIKQLDTDLGARVRLIEELQRRSFGVFDKDHRGEGEDTCSKQ